MAVVEKWYRCPACNASYSTYKEAAICRNKHAIREELWAVGKYKSVRIQDDYAPDSLGGINWALKEADLSDIISVRNKQLAGIEEQDEVFIKTGYLRSIK